MVEQQKNINVTVISEGQAHQLNTFVNEYRNLMMLIYDRVGPEDFGDCLGMGKCGTCLVQIEGNENVLSFYDRNEATTLAKARLDKNSRLACQILIDENLNGAIITLMHAPAGSY